LVVSWTRICAASPAMRRQHLVPGGRRSLTAGIPSIGLLLREWPLREILGVLHDGEGIAIVLHHLAPELTHRRLVGLGVEGEWADRRVEAQPEHRLGDVGGLDALRLLDAG